MAIGGVGGNGSIQDPVPPASGGLAAGGVGTVKYSGGYGAGGVLSFYSSGGGGGAAGPFGDGGAGGDAQGYGQGGQGGYGDAGHGGAGGAPVANQPGGNGADDAHRGWHGPALALARAAATWRLGGDAPGLATLAAGVVAMAELALRARVA